VAIPLNIPSDEMAVLRQMAGGATSEAQLTRRNSGDRETVVTTLKALIRRGMIEPSGPGEYRLRYHLRELDSGSR
jgi:DNA-binding IclR family transcriptional regulator